MQTPTNLRITQTTTNTITTAWDRVVGAHHYNVFRDGNLLGSPQERAETTPSFMDQGLWPQSTHTYYVSAVDSLGNVSPPTPSITSSTKTDLAGPTPPTNVNVVFRKAVQRVFISWMPSVDPESGLDHYEVWRDLVKIADVPIDVLHYLDKSPPMNVTVMYLVNAIDRFGNSSPPGQQVRIITDDTPPSAPGNLHFNAVTANSVSLEWEPSIDNFTVKRYLIFANGALLKFQEASAGTTAFVGPLTPGDYRFFIRAKDQSNNVSSPSNRIATTITG